MDILSVRGALPPHRYAQEDITDAFASVITLGAAEERLLRRLHANAGVRHRHLVLPLEEYGGLEGFGQANDRVIAGAPQLGSQALGGAPKAADPTPRDAGPIHSTPATR